MPKFLADLVERVVATYVQALATLLIVSPATNMSSVKSASVAAIPAALAVVKGLAASFVGDSQSASLIPGRKK